MARLFPFGLLRRRPRSWLIILGISAAITMLAPSMISVAMISIIGIPIAIFLMAAPFLFLVVVGTKLIARGMGGGWLATIAGAVVTLLLLAVPPYFANMKLENQARSLVAQDREDGTKPTGKVVAVRADRFWGRAKDTLNCDGFCQRALLNGVADRVLVVEQDLGLALNPMLEVDSFHLERRASCPPVKLPQGHDPIEIRDERRDWKGKRVDELMQLEIAKGNCLIAGKGPLGAADIVLTVGNVRRGKNALSAGLSLFADTVRADRIAMHEKQGGVFVETYRKTFVTTYKLAPLYAPTAEGGAELRMFPALARRRDTINITEKYYDKPDWTAFLVDRLGYDLALRAGQAEEDTRAVLKNALIRPSVGEAVPAQVGSDFFSNVQRSRVIAGDDLTIARQLLADERFSVPSSAVTAVLYAKDAAPDYFEDIAAAMFKRLRAISAADEGKKYPVWREEASHIGNVIRQLPAAAVMNHREDLDWLAKEDRVRVRAWEALIRFSEFGAEGAERLIWLIDDSSRFAKERDDDWQHPNLAGLIGLCEMGAAGANAIQPLYDRLDSGVILNRGSYQRLAVHALVRMGANPDEIWLHAREQGANAEKDAAKARRQFDREVERAMKREECWY